MSTQQQAALSLVSSCFGLVWFGDYEELKSSCAFASACFLLLKLCNVKSIPDTVVQCEKYSRYMYHSK